ncbi:MAG: MoaD/ThiS family protein [Methanosarcinales archaeon]|jgi:molybdopterin synthase sulfur carrier subunit|nr:MoaD/ThiS family protein [Methanosarcinales archaeon]
MATITVKLFANIKEQIGKSNIECKGDTVLTILEFLINQYPTLKNMIFTNNIKKIEIIGSINIFLNGNNIHHLNGLSTKVKDGDELGIFPPVSGG